MEKKLVIIAAPAACGKTFVAEQLARCLGRVVYLDKDDLAALLHCGFRVADKPIDMDGDFYLQNLRDGEYATILRIAFSAFRFEDIVLLNAPFVKEVRDVEYMQALKRQVRSYGGKLVVVWVSTPTELCRTRMIRRGSPRDKKKLENWDEYLKNTNFLPPTGLVEQAAVDNLIVIDTSTDESFSEGLQTALSVITK